MSLLNDIKAINQRLADYEKQGYAETRDYKNLVREVEKSGLQLTKSKSGTIRISRSKQNISNGKVKTQYGIKLDKSTVIDRLKNKKTLGDVKKEVRKTFGKLTKDEQRKKALELSEVRDFIESEKSEWYLLFSKYASENTRNIKEYNDTIHNMMVDITSKIKEERALSLDDYIKNAPDYIVEALEDDI